MQRKIFHIASGLLIVVLLNGKLAAGANQRWLVSVFVLISLLFLLLNEGVRSRHSQYNLFFMGLFGTMMKRREKSEWLGATYYALAVLLAVAFFPKILASLSIIHLAVGDPAASFWGQRVRPSQNDRKTMSGLFAFWLVSIACGSLYLLWIWGRGDVARPLWGNQVFLSALLFANLGGALVAGLIERYSRLLFQGRFDDNFSIPMFSGLTMTIILRILEQPLSYAMHFKL